MKQSRTRLSLAIISGILPLFFMLALIVPLWIFFTGERYFLSTLLHFAEVPLTDNPAQAPGMARHLLLLALLYLPAGLFAFAIWQGGAEPHPKRRSLSPCNDASATHGAHQTPLRRYS